ADGMNKRDSSGVGRYRRAKITRGSRQRCGDSSLLTGVERQADYPKRGIGSGRAGGIEGLAVARPCEQGSPIGETTDIWPGTGSAGSGGRGRFDDTRQFAMLAPRRGNNDDGRFLAEIAE